MKLLFTIVIGLALALLIGVFASQNEGFLVFSVADWTIQTSVNFFIITLLLSFIFFYFFFRFLGRLFSARKSLRKYRDRKDTQRSSRFLNDGMTALIEGDWQKAERILKKGATFSDKPEIYYLGAAKAAQQLGATERRDDYLKLAHGNNGNTAVAVGLTQAKLQLEQNQSEQALATLTNLHSDNPKQPQVNKLLLKSHLDMKDWDAVIHLLPELKKQKILSADAISAYEQQAYAGLLEQAGDSGVALELGKTWLSIPKKYRSELYLIDVYVQQRLKLGEHQDSEILLRKALKKNWDERLVTLYGLVESHDLAQQLKTAEGMLKQHPRDAALFFTLGRLCIKNQLWGKARSYLQECVEIRPSPEVFYELARLLKQMNEPQLASDFNQKGLELATRSSSSMHGKQLLTSQDPEKVDDNDSTDSLLEEP